MRGYEQGGLEIPFEVIDVHHVAIRTTHLVRIARINAELGAEAVRLAGELHSLKADFGRLFAAKSKLAFDLMDTRAELAKAQADNESFVEAHGRDVARIVSLAEQCVRLKERNDRQYATIGELSEKAERADSLQCMVDAFSKAVKDLAESLELRFVIDLDAADDAMEVTIGN